MHYGSISLDMMSGEYQTDREIYFNKKQLRAKKIREVNFINIEGIVSDERISEMRNISSQFSSWRNVAQDRDFRMDHSK